VAWVHSGVGGFAIACADPPGDTSSGVYDSVQNIKEHKVKPGQRVSVRITVPAGDTWQLGITGGPASSVNVVPGAS
jgi:hypothetical protein